MTSSAKCKCAETDRLIICPDCDPERRCASYGYALHYRQDYDGSNARFIWAKIKGSDDRWGRHFSTKEINVIQARRYVEKVIKNNKDRAELKPTAKPITLKYLFDRWMKEGSSLASANKRKKVQQVFNAYKKTQVFTHLEVEKITHQDLMKMACHRAIVASKEGYLKNGKMKTSTVVNELFIIKQVYEYGVKGKLCLACPTFVLPLPNHTELERCGINGSQLFRNAKSNDTNVFRPTDQWVNTFVKNVESSVAQMQEGRRFSVEGTEFGNVYPAQKYANALSVARGSLACILTITSSIRSQELNKLTFAELDLDTDTPNINVSRVKKNENQQNFYFVRSHHKLVLDLLNAIVLNFKRLNQRDHTGTDLVFCNGVSGTRDATVGRLNREVFKAVCSVGSSIYDNTSGVANRVSITALRHFHITTLIKAGNNPDQVALYCGTSSTMIFQHYLDLFKKDTIKASGKLIWEL